MKFLDLPLELLSHILCHLARPQHIASVCLVNKVFHQFGVPRLYERVSIYSWHKHGKAKVVCLFRTLANYPHLAKYVLKLGPVSRCLDHGVLSEAHTEIRDFPKSLGAMDTDELVLNGLKNCLNLQACTWTRDGSLNSAILSVLRASQTLRELEINGHSDGNYDAGILAGFAHLRRISLIMPSARVVRQFNSWMALTGATLCSLTLICKMSPLITDDILGALAPSLVHLDQFSITGCPRVGHAGIWAIISQNIAGIVRLGLEGLPSKFNMDRLSQLCVRSDALAHLKAITLSLDQETWLTSVSTMLSTAPLEVFQIYATSAFVQSSATEAFWRDVVTTHGPRLTRFSVHRMLISLRAIEDVCVRCTSLLQLFVVIDHASLEPLTQCLSRAKKIREVHVNFQGDAPVLLKAPDALAIVRRCPQTIVLFGCNARVWQVEREIKCNERGELFAERFLAKYESPDIPEQFLVVRT
ncbi:hypothetical protein B0H10DRAFT_1786141 [Mycena sp. CBHHK59/15]|nr:hypothetical protein B0H10DRAFT_1786141 [Mycena sp. CBHHK59/15]